MRERDLVSKAEKNMIDEDTTCQLLLALTSTHTNIQTHTDKHTKTQPTLPRHRLPVTCTVYSLRYIW